MECQCDDQICVLITRRAIHLHSHLAQALVHSNKVLHSQPFTVVCRASRLVTVSILLGEDQLDAVWHSTQALLAHAEVAMQASLQRQGCMLSSTSQLPPACSFKALRTAPTLRLLRLRARSENGETGAQIGLSEDVLERLKKAEAQAEQLRRELATLKQGQVSDFGFQSCVSLACGGAQLLTWPCMCRLPQQNRPHQSPQ